MIKSTFVVMLLVFMNAINVSANTDLFHVKRNKNKNEFHYEGLIEGCRWQNPATRGQWYMLAKGPDQREKIAMWEGSAYGHETRVISSSQIIITLNAKKDLPVTIDLIKYNGSCEAVPTTQINGNPAKLRFVYVCARERTLWFPEIHYVEVHGFNGEGQPVVARFPQTNWAKNLEDAAPLKVGENPPMNAPRCGH